MGEIIWETLAMSINAPTTRGQQSFITKNQVDGSIRVQIVNIRVSKLVKNGLREYWVRDQ